MSDVVIRAEGLSKQYRLGRREGYYTLRDTLAGLTWRFRNRWRRAESRDRDTSFWALRDVSFEVRRGEVVGVIGRNGAGKSTLLKILARIAEPTEGWAELRGRVGSLLEVGTGFHPELTGRENIHLSGAILGMRRAEIRRKFDEIVQFAEVERFLDTPVKHFSSGMYMRLAFAVAAHLEPEILMVDEVLAVGDATFQKKCLGKIRTLTQDGRTVLFVSHNVSTIRQLCSQVLLLESGRLRMPDRDTDGIIAHYLAEAAGGRGHCIWPAGFANPGVDDLFILGVCVRDRSGRVTSEVERDQPFTIEILYRVDRHLERCRVGFLLSSSDGTCILDAYDSDFDPATSEKCPGTFVTRCQVPGHLFRPGRYLISVNAGIYGERNLAYLENVLAVSFRDSAAPFVAHLNRGLLCPQLEWTVQRGASPASWQDPQGSTPTAPNVWPAA
jgi:lipopolysaccharide transport system ATP-binding protein